MRILAAMSVLVSAILTGPAAATTLLQMDFHEVARAADGVLEGTVTDITSRRSENGIIHSFVTLGNLEVLGGRYDGKAFTLRIEGGEVSGEIQEVEGAPQFREGERVIVFVEGNGERIVPIAGWEQGLFRIVTDPQTGAEYVVDAVGNQVFGFRNGELVKETRMGSQAELFGQGAGARAGAFAQSEKPEIDFGRVNGGRQVLPEEERAELVRRMEMQAIVGEPITLAAFKQQIGRQIKAAGVGEMRALNSVEPGSMSEPQLQDAAPAREPTGGEGLNQSPAERAKVPRRIQEGPRPDLDRER